MNGILEQALMASLVTIQSTLTDVESNYNVQSFQMAKCPSCDYGCSDACGKKCAGGCSHPTY